MNYKHKDAEYYRIYMKAYRMGLTPCERQRFMDEYRIFSRIGKSRIIGSVRVLGKSDGARQYAYDMPFTAKDVKAWLASEGEARGWRADLSRLWQRGIVGKPPRGFLKENGPLATEVWKIADLGCFDGLASYGPFSEWFAGLKQAEADRLACIDRAEERGEPR